MRPAGSVTGNEQVSAAQTKACGSRDARICACAGCDGGSASAERAQHDAVEQRELQRAAASASARAPVPVTTISAPRSRRSSALSSAHVHEEVSPAAGSDAVDQPVGLVRARHRGR